MVWAFQNVPAVGFWSTSNEFSPRSKGELDAHTVFFTSSMPWTLTLSGNEDTLKILKLGP